jgi:hypothetical protein
LTDEIIFTGSNKFDSEAANKARSISVNYELNKLNFDKYFHMFIVQEDTLRLVGLREKFTLFIQSNEVVHLEAAACGCKGPE